MIAKPIIAKTLEEYYNNLYDLQASRHGKDYLLVHNEIKDIILEGNSYTELGIMQGTTLALALLNTHNKVRAYDKDLKWYNKSKVLFDEFATNHNIDYLVEKKNTLEFSIEPTDVLYIDTLHTYDQLSQELKIHGKFAHKYIICHDTENKPPLKKAIQKFIQEHNQWGVVTECKINVGFITLARSY